MTIYIFLIWSQNQKLQEKEYGKVGVKVTVSYQKQDIFNNFL